MDRGPVGSTSELNFNGRKGFRVEDVQASSHPHLLGTLLCHASSNSTQMRMNPEIEGGFPLRQSKGPLESSWHQHRSTCIYFTLDSGQTYTDDIDNFRMLINLSNPRFL